MLGSGGRDSCSRSQPGLRGEGLQREQADVTRRLPGAAGDHTPGLLPRRELSRPPIDQPAMFRAFITQVLAGQLAVSTDTLLVPLGDAASTTVNLCVAGGAIRREQCLLGFPHPSSGNGHRKRQCAERQELMAQAAADWFGGA